MGWAQQVVGWAQQVVGWARRVAGWAQPVVVGWALRVEGLGLQVALEMAKAQASSAAASINSCRLSLSVRDVSKAT
jgi:hypothetical protein